MPLVLFTASFPLISPLLPEARIPPLDSGAELGVLHKEKKKLKKPPKKFWRKKNQQPKMTVKLRMLRKSLKIHLQVML